MGLWTWLHRPKPIDGTGPATSYGGHAGAYGSGNPPASEKPPKRRTKNQGTGRGR